MDLLKVVGEFLIGAALGVMVVGQKENKLFHAAFRHLSANNSTMLSVNGVSMLYKHVGMMYHE